MIESSITDKFDGGGLEIKPSGKENINDLNYDSIVNSFERKGIILFRDYSINSNNISKVTDLYTEKYARDALRREVRLGQKVIHNVDRGHEEMALHSEASFSPNWPEIVWFFCNIPPSNGGATTLCDGIKLWSNLTYEAKNFFLLNPIKYKLSIPIGKKIPGKEKKRWLLNNPGSGNGLLDWENGLLNITQIRFAVHPSRLPNKVCFANHTLFKDTDPTILYWSTIDEKKLPKNILDEINDKSREITYDIKWKKNDLLMIDNKRFLHGRRRIESNDHRDIVNIQTSTANFGYGSTTRKKGIQEN